MLIDVKCPQCGTTTELLVKLEDRNSGNHRCSSCSFSGCVPLITGARSFRLYGEGFSKRSHRDTGDFAG